MFITELMFGGDSPGFGRCCRRESKMQIPESKLFEKFIANFSTKTSRTSLWEKHFAQLVRDKIFIEAIRTRDWTALRHFESEFPLQQGDRVRACRQTKKNREQTKLHSLPAPTATFL
jgi:hypothetical protein